MNADYTPTRRVVLTTTGTALAGGAGLVALGSDRTRAQVTLGSLDVSGTSASLSDPPSEMVVTVDGALSVDGSPPDKSVAILEIQLGGTAFDLDTEIFQDAPSSAEFQLSGNIYDWRGISPGDLFPQEPGGSTNVNFVVRLKCQAYRDGGIVAEDMTEDDVTVTLQNGGMEIVGGGAGNVTVA